MKPYEVLLHRRVERKLYTLPKSLLRRIYQLISELEINPVPWRKWDVRKIRGEEDVYRIRIGKYRLIYWVNWKERKIIILKIARRERVYE